MSLATYFDKLTQDELLTILRRNAAQTELHTLLFPAVSPFARALPLCFNTIRLCMNNVLQCDLLKRQLKVGISGDISEEYRRIFHACGRVFDSVILGKNTSEHDYDGWTHWIRNSSTAKHIAPYVTHGATLTIHQASPTNSTFEQKVINEIRVCGILLNQPSMEMVACVAKWPSLKRFSWRGPVVGVLNALWLSVGNSLEQVDLLSIGEGVSGWSSCLEHLRKHCRRLNWVRLENPLDDHNVSDVEYADFLISYGKQLEYANLSCQALGIDAIQHVVRKCTHLRCAIVEKHNRLDRAIALHSRVDELDLALHVRTDMESLRNAMNACRNLCTLRVSLNFYDEWSPALEEFRKPPLHDSYIESMFVSRLQWLKTLRIDPILTLPSLRHIANGTSSLKSIHLKFLKLAPNMAPFLAFPPDMHPFLALAKANPGLEEITIEEIPEVDEPNSQVLRVIDGLLFAFRYCHDLKVIRLYFYTTDCPCDAELGDVCSKYRIKPWSIKLLFHDTPSVRI